MNELHQEEMSGMSYLNG